MGKTHKQILISDRADLSIEIAQLNEFMNLVSNAKITEDFRKSIMNVTNSQIQEKRFFYDEIETDLNDINVDVGGLVDEELTAEAEDIMIEAGLEQIREERENEN